MVHLAIFDPARKIKQFVQLILARSKRARQTSSRQARITACGPSKTMKSVLDHALPGPVSYLTSAKHSLKGDIDVRDEQYYPSWEQTRDEEENYCILKMENTLFKVHKSILMQDSCVFLDGKFIQSGSHSLMDTTVIHLPESASRFRDLLWALHNLDVNNPHFVYQPSILRLLNIAELSRKYHFLTFEAWSVDQLDRICASGPLPFSLSTDSASASSITLINALTEDTNNVDSMCSRLLKVAYTSRHSSLFLLMIKKVVVHTLWHEFHPGPVLVECIETLSRARSRYQRHVHQLLGVVYYRILVDMNFVISDNTPVVLFPEDMDVERRMCFLSAHKSLDEMWDNLKHAPPEVSFSPGSQHDSCQLYWDRLWVSATKRAEYAPCSCKHRCRSGHRRHTADVLALLKLTMMTVSQTVEHSTSICAECSLAGLESMDVIRDDIINTLGDLFVYC